MAVDKNNFFLVFDRFLETFCFFKLSFKSNIKDILETTDFKVNLSGVPK